MLGEVMIGIPKETTSGEVQEGVFYYFGCHGLLVHVLGDDAS